MKFFTAAPHACLSPRRAGAISSAPMSLTPGVGSGPFCAVEGLAQIAGALAACDELRCRNGPHISPAVIVSRSVGRPRNQGHERFLQQLASTFTRVSGTGSRGRRPFPCCKRLQFNDSSIFLEIARDDGGHALRVFAKSRLA